MTRTESIVSTKVVCDISISADGYAAGPGQTAEKPFGDGPVDRLHAWMFDTPDGNKAEIDQIVSAGAFVMGSWRPGRPTPPACWTGASWLQESGPTSSPCDRTARCSPRCSPAGRRCEPNRRALAPMPGS